jgi:hypothetical protein
MPLGESEDVVAGPWLTPPGEPDAMAAALRMPLGESEDVVAGPWLTPPGEPDAVAAALWCRQPCGSHWVNLMQRRRGSGACRAVSLMPGWLGNLTLSNGG